MPTIKQREYKDGAWEEYVFEVMECMFCGGDPHWSSNRGPQLCCDSCRISGPSAQKFVPSNQVRQDGFEDYEKASKLWNALQARLARLEYLEAMLADKDSAGGKSEKGRL